MRIQLAFSTCPNDTFIFNALVNQVINTDDLNFSVKLADIHELNQIAFAGEADMVKLSFNAFAQVQDKYELLSAGSALGSGCGPLLIARSGSDLASLRKSNGSIAIPGKATTANLLLSFFAPELTHRKEMLFHEIMPAVISGKVDAGLIIHENRFTYARYGLEKLSDLGEFWEKETSLPIPLGAIAVRKSLPAEIKAELASLMKLSVDHAFANPETSMPYVRKHAQEMDEEVMKAHIQLYVNEFTKDLGNRGSEAIKRLMTEGEKAGLFSSGTAASFQGPLYPSTNLVL